MSRLTDLINEVRRPAPWIPFKPDPVTNRQSDQPNPDVPNPLAGRFIREETGQANGRDVPIKVVETEEGDQYGIWLFPENDKGEPPLLTKVWLEKDPPVGAEVAIISAPLVKSATTGHNYHPIRVAYREASQSVVDEVLPPDPVAAPGEAEALPY
jgi:hypothetical protein